MSRYAKLRSDLVSVPAEIDGQTVFNIKDPITGNYFRLREPEFWLISQLDGQTPPEDIAARFHEKFNLDIAAADVLQFVEALESQFFLENVRSEQKVSRKSYLTGEQESLFSRLLFIKVKAFNPGKFLDFLTALYRPFHTPFWMVVQWLTIAVGIAVILANRSLFSVAVAEVFNIGSILTIVFSFFLILVLHEFAHAIICRYYGGEVKEMGILIMYFQPLVFCDLSDAWLFPEKRHRLATTWAGLYSSILLMALTAILWRVTVPGTTVNDIARVTSIILWIAVLLNFNPLIKLDGYYLLSDWLEIPNLRSKAFHYLGHIFKRKILGWPIEELAVTPRERKIFTVYSLLAVVYSGTLIIYFLKWLAVFLIDKMGGVGLILLAAILFFTLRSNIVALIKGSVQHLKYMKHIMKTPVRLTVYIIGTILLITLVFVIRFPHRVTGEVTVQPVAEFGLVINDLGLLEKRFRRGGEAAESKSSYVLMTSGDLATLDLIPLVRDGQPVREGDTLAVLASNQVTTELESARSSLEKLESDLALLKSPPKTEEIDQAVAEVNAAQSVYDQKLRDERRIQALVEKNLGSQGELEIAQSATAVARAELENKKAKVRLLKSPPKPEQEAVIRSEIDKQKAAVQFLTSQEESQSILSPIAGVVVINPKDDCFLSVVENDQVEVLVPVTDFDIRLVEPAQTVKLKVRSYTDRVFEGRVVHIPKDATLSGEQACFQVSTIVDNGDELLHKGMTGYAKIEVGKASLFSLFMRKMASIVRVEFWSWW